MADLEKKLITFYDGTAVKAAFVSQESKGKFIVHNEHGKQFKIPEKNILFAHKDTTLDKSSSEIVSLQKQIDAAQEDIDTEMLWEMVVEEGESTIKDLAEHYYGESDEVMKASLYHAVGTDNVRFKRKAVNFLPRTEKQVAEQLEAIRKKQEKEKFLAEVTPWLESAVKSQDEDLEIPEEFKSFVGQLKAFIFNQKANEASKILQSVCPEQLLPKEAAFELLKKAGYVDKDADRFLILAGIDETFTQRGLQHTEEIPYYVKDSSGREDLTHLFSYSIDDQETRDIDDALSIEKTEKGWRVGIHIADVSEFVKMGDALDEEASNRVTSIYLPTRTVNMVPERLSQELASLVSGDVRPALTFFAEISEEGEMLDWRATRSQVHIDHKLNYDGVDALISKLSNGEDCGEESEIAEQATVLNELAEKIREQRLERGAAIFNRPEMKIRVYDDVVTVKECRAESASRFLVSEYMIMANSLAARYCARNDVPFLFRIQDKPEGLPDLDPNSYDPILFEKAIKCMKKSRTSTNPSIHGGLGVDFYSQITSPIRRFGDLVLQRQISAHLHGETLPYSSEGLMQVMAAADLINNDVRQVQRSAEDYWLHEFIRCEYEGKEIEATVISKGKVGYNVELDTVYHRCALPVPQKLSPGTRITVRVEKVKPRRNYVQLFLVSVNDTDSETDTENEE